MLGRETAGCLTGHGINLDKIAVEAVVHQNPITEKLVAPLRMPAGVLADLQTAWNKFAGPVKSKTSFTFSHGLHESRHGFVVLLVKWERNILDVGFTLLPLDDPEKEDDEQDELPEEGIVELWQSIMPKVQPEDEAKWLDQVWVPIIPVEQIIKTEKQIQPNDPCSCGSGRKFKKCCGRLT